MRRLLIVLAVIVVLIGSGAIALHFYLRSDRVTGEVVAKIEAVYGGKGKVGAVDLGLSGSGVSEIQLFEKDPKASGPWLKIAQVSTDVSLWELLRGAATPQHRPLHKPAVLLRFDRDGRLLTEVPLPQGKQAEGALDPEA